MVISCDWFVYPYVTRILIVGYIVFFILFRLSSLLSVSSALHSLPEAHLSGGPVDLSPQIKHIVKNLVSYCACCHYVIMDYFT